MTRLAILTAASTLLTLSGAPFLPPPPPPDKAEWTIMVYMNGDNSLELESVEDYKEMMAVGSRSNVHVVVQYDRLTAVPPDFTWSDTRRFHVEAGQKPTKEHAIVFNPPLGELDMGDGKVLGDFVRWAWRQYPARRHALIIWNHGFGWRDFAGFGHQTMGRMSAMAAVSHGAKLPPGLDGLPFRAVSSDDTSGNRLYNQEIEITLKKVLAEIKNDSELNPPPSPGAAPPDVKLDLLGFDSCLMQMVETAYAMKDVAKVMVASEELEDGTGWNYEDWLKRLVDNPSQSERALASALVTSFKKFNADTLNKKQTLSAVDLSQAEALATRVSAFADALTTRLDDESAAFRDTRQNLKQYGFHSGGFLPTYNIDLQTFADRIAIATKDVPLQTAAQAVSQAITSMVFARYAGASRDKTTDYGSRGLAIYFPPDKTAYIGDQLAENGYERGVALVPGDKASQFSVDFVQQFHWTDFLHAYFERVPGGSQ